MSKNDSSYVRCTPNLPVYGSNGAFSESLAAHAAKSEAMKQMFKDAAKSGVGRMWVKS